VEYYKLALFRGNYVDNFGVVCVSCLLFGKEKLIYFLGEGKMNSFLRLSCCIIIILSTSIYAGTIQLTATELGGGKIAIGYNVTSGGNVPIGFGLNLTLSGGATFGSVISTSSLFPLFPGTIVFDMHGNVTSWGSPVSPMGSPGTLGSLGTSDITIEMSTDVAVQPAGYHDSRDLNRDGLIDYLDYNIFVENWLMADYLVNGDFNGDSVVNMGDMALIASSESIPLNLSQLLIVQINSNGATNPTLHIVPETTYRGGVVQADGVVFSVTPATLVIPEPTTILLLSLGGMVLRRLKTS
jgi:hypothetical protein